MKYYIKNNIIFSNETTKIKVIDKVENIEIPDTEKNSNIFINNKFLIEEIEKTIQNKGKNYEISKPIENIKDIIKNLKSKKEELKKVTSDDYTFLEKTSAIEIIDTILISVQNSNMNNIKEQIEDYIKKIKKQEDNKYAQLNESIEIEKNKIYQTKEKKEETIQNSKIREIEELENKKNNIELEISNLKSPLTINNKEDEYISNIKEKQSKLISKIQDYKFQIKLIKNSIKTLKIDLKLGKNKHFNWINSILMIITLGLIYWTKFTDIKYFILIYQKKITKYEEKITILENKSLKLKNKLSKLDNSNNDIKEKENNQKSKIILLNNELNKINTQIKSYQQKIKKEDSKLGLYDKDIIKIETKIIELKSQKEEYDKYSYKKLEKILNNLMMHKSKQEEILKEIKEKIQNQKTEINGEFIFNI